MINNILAYIANQQYILSNINNLLREYEKMKNHLYSIFVLLKYLIQKIVKLFLIPIFFFSIGPKKLARNI